MTPSRRDPDPPVEGSTIVYTDGACSGNPGPGGWAWVVPHGPWANGADPDTTNQRMELTAVLEAVLALDGPVHVISDSTYVVNCFRDRWWEGWLRRDWLNSKKEPVANRDLWEPLVELYQSRPGQITFQWVKGHAGDEWNDVADRLAVEASVRQQGRTGTGIPDDLGPPDEIAVMGQVRPLDEMAVMGEEGPPGEIAAVGEDRPFDGMGAGETADAPPGAGRAAAGKTAAPATVAEPANSTWRPSGRTVVVLGVTPTHLGGYDENPTAAAVRRRLRQIIEAKHALDPELAVLTGLRLGAETLAAEAARQARVPYVAVLAHPELDARWPAATRARFRDLLGGAAAVVQLERKIPESPTRAGQAVDRRNGWLRKVADEAVIVWDGVDRRVRSTIDAYERELEDVWVVDVATAAGTSGR